MDREIELVQQLNHWRSVAVRLADIHAANPEGEPGRMKRLSKREKQRQIGILNHCIQDLSKYYPVDGTYIAQVISRCENSKKYYL